MPLGVPRRLLVALDGTAVPVRRGPIVSEILAQVERELAHGAPGALLTVPLGAAITTASNSATDR